MLVFKLTLVMARNLLARDYLDLFNSIMGRLLEKSDTLALGFFAHYVFETTNDNFITHEVSKYARATLRMASTAHFDTDLWQANLPD